VGDTAEQRGPGRPSLAPVVASTLAWLLGVLELLSAVAISIPQIAAGVLPVVPFGLALLGALSCTAGYLLRKRRRLGGIIALALVAFSVVSRVLNGSAISVDFAVILALLVLVLVAWKELR